MVPHDRVLDVVCMHRFGMTRSGRSTFYSKWTFLRESVPSKRSVFDRDWAACLLDGDMDMAIRSRYLILTGALDATSAYPLVSRQVPI